LALDGVQRYFESMAVISEIRHTMDTNDSFYRGEEDFFQIAKVEFEALIQERNQAILSSVFADEIRAFLSPAVVDRLIAVMDERVDCSAGTLACFFKTQAEADNPNNVKVVLDEEDVVSLVGEVGR